MALNQADWQHLETILIVSVGCGGCQTLYSAQDGLGNEELQSPHIHSAKAGKTRLGNLMRRRLTHARDPKKGEMAGCSDAEQQEATALQETWTSLDHTRDASVSPWARRELGSGVPPGVTSEVVHQGHLEGELTPLEGHWSHPQMCRQRKGGQEASRRDHVTQDHCREDR